MFEKILITGCGGMLGNAIYPAFSAKSKETFASDKVVNETWLHKLDVRDTSKLANVFKSFRPDLVLHLAAETDLEFCETNPDIAKDTNSIATKTIAKLSEEIGATLVYISTAGVFDGKKEGFYVEEDKPNPIMVYGQTKYEGEIHTTKYCSKSYVVRAGWMMGGGISKEKKFIYKILLQIAEGKKAIYAVNDKWGTPTYTYDFARNLFALIQTMNYGTYHMVCQGNGTRLDVASEILKVCNRPDIKLIPVDSDFFKEEYFAPRPHSEMMTNKNLNNIGLNSMRSWKEALEDYIKTHFSSHIVTQKIPVLKKRNFRTRKIQSYPQTKLPKIVNRSRADCIK